MSWTALDSQLTSDRGDPALQLQLGLLLDEADLPHPDDIDFADGTMDFPV